MPLVYFGLGSNLRPEDNLPLGARELGARFTIRARSAVYRNPAVGFEGDDFLNAVIGVETDWPPDEICAALEDIHAAAGRRRTADPYVSRTLDIDLLLYGREIIDAPPVRVPRCDVLQYSFVLRPLAEIAPDYVHPVSGKSLAWHWQQFDQDLHPLTREDLDW